MNNDEKEDFYYFIKIKKHSKEGEEIYQISKIDYYKIYLALRNKKKLLIEFSPLINRPKKMVGEKLNFLVPKDNVLYIFNQEK